MKAKIAIVSTVCAAILCVGTPSADAQETDSGWVSCTGTENAYATGYGNAFLQSEIVFESYNTSNATYYRYLTSPPGFGSGNWATSSSDDLIHANSYGHCG